MNYYFIFTIFIIGLGGITAQVLILRELLVSFCGNELTIGIILANWLLGEAIGSFLIGRYIEKVKNKINIFILLQLVFSLSFPLAIYSSRVFKGILGIPFGEAIGLYAIFLTSFFIILPLAFCHGGLFSASCKIYSFYSKEAGSIGRVYGWETLGTLIGGIILTYLFIPHLNSFQIVFIISISTLLVSIILFKYNPNKISRKLPSAITYQSNFRSGMVFILSYTVKYLTVSVTIFLIYLSATRGIRDIQQISIERQWNIGRVLDYQNSIYGNIVLIKKDKQLTFFYNGMPAITTPYPDTASVEEFAHLPLLFHPGPRDVLVISGGAGGIIKELLKHPVRKVDYLELDPSIIAMLNKYPTSLTKDELTDKRVNIINLDGRLFLRKTPNKYDVILIGVSNPSDLSTNRLFTEEFFLLAKSRLKPAGITAFRLPGSLTYLSREMKDLNFCILNGLKNAYDYVRIVPGEYNMFIASSYRGILDAGAGSVSQKISRQNIKTSVLLPDYLSFRLDKKWTDWFMRSSLGATNKTNRDFAPFAVFEMLVFWNKQFSPGLAHLLGNFENLNLKIISVFIFIISLIAFYIIRRKRKICIAYCIATTGFFGMLINLILIFSFQIFYGYLYHSIGILISIFMAGIAAGSIFITRNLQKIKNEIRLFLRLEAAIILLSFVLALIITRLAGYLQYTPLLFMLMCFLPGFLLGLQFPLAGKIYSKEKEGAGEVAGELYFSDLIGGWIAGIFGGVILLPVLGLFKTCMVIAIFKLSSLLLLSLNKNL